MLRTSFFNVSLRGLTLVSKASALIFIARMLAPSDLGTYGLFVATVSYAVFALGMEFYTFSSREILKNGRDVTAKCIREQAVFHLLLYPLIFPLLLLVFYFHYLPSRYVGWFYCILILEHGFREVYRILIVLMRPLQASVVFFMASGFWPWIAVPLMVWNPELRNLGTVWAAWTFGLGCGLIVAGWWLRDFEWASAFRMPIDWSWIRNGFRSSIVLVGASLSLSAITTLDRYFIRHYRGDSMVGFYVFYASIASAIFAFLDTGVVSIHYPKVVMAFQLKQYGAYRNRMKKFGISLLAGLIGLISISVLGISPILHLLNRQAYTEHLGVYWIMLAMVSIWSIGLIPHYALYARRKDKAITLSNLTGLCVAVSSWPLLIPIMGIKGCALGVLLGMLTVATSKAVCLLNAESYDCRPQETGMSTLNLEADGAQE